MAEIKKPGASPALQRRREPLTLGECRKIRLRRREAGERDEDLGGVGEAIIDRREMRQCIAGDVIDEDDEERSAAQKVDPVLAAGMGRGCHGDTLNATIPCAQPWPSPEGAPKRPSVATMR